MPFVPFSSLDPEAPSGHPAPVLWLRGHVARWAFPANTTDERIHAYALWLHVLRIKRGLGVRERSLRPPLSFRARLCIHRLRFFWQAVNGTVPDDVLREIARADSEPREPDHD
jgi:hypothetical protein